jgi:hypothetical protein
MKKKTTENQINQNSTTNELINIDTDTNKLINIPDQEIAEWTDTENFVSAAKSGSTTVMEQILSCCNNQQKKIPGIAVSRALISAAENGHKPAIEWLVCNI